ncbi:paraquat-inducible protein A [Uliginosibacterium sp. H3]|uniref:Paraquat-inducible protein A n=1 Tax=Uliginosibacterium silvisoli TaxID=3114758 RepID=A0ABU6K421_9RHOO|nr:paraquat-inducible protein A [Uliginosibacterium sp. H3]
MKHAADSPAALAAHFPAGSAARSGLTGCHACGQIVRLGIEARAQCPRCGSSVHLRKPNSLSRCWAFLIAAMVLYVPANVLPIMITTSFGDTQSNTILSGIIVLWNSGSWDLALIVFIASMVVPLGKLLALVVLLFSVQRHPLGNLRQLSRLYRLVEMVGKWSMLDVYVVTLLATVVRFDAFMSVHAGSGALAFGGVVVLTMLAAQAFDPRLLWDAAHDDEAQGTARLKTREEKNNA